MCSVFYKKIYTKAILYNTYICYTCTAVLYYVESYQNQLSPHTFENSFSQKISKSGTVIIGIDIFVFGL